MSGEGITNTRPPLTPGQQAQADPNPLLAQGVETPGIAGPQGGAPGIMRPPPAPSHQETVAALRHFHEIQRQLGPLLKNPKIGKSDMKGEVYTVGALLLGDGFMSLPEVMTALKSFPKEPIDQRKWIEQHYNNAVAAQQKVLDDHAAHVGPGSGDFATEWGAKTALDPDMAHGDLMSSIMGHYKGRKNGG